MIENAPYTGLWTNRMGGLKLIESSLRSGFHKARLEAQLHMRNRLNHGLMWDERTVTDLFLAAATNSTNSADIRYAVFTPQQESKIGADWLWWFVDRSDECFGMLVQAKSLKLTGTQFRFDFEYRRSGQITNLLDSSDILNVPAAYALYCGDAAYRRSRLRCQQGCSQPSYCSRCEEKSVSVVAAQIVRHSIDYGPSMSASWSFEHAQGIETLGDPKAPLYAAAFRSSPDALKRFLIQPQSGARAIARSLLDQVVRARAGQMAAATTQLVETDGEEIFLEVPDDRGHFSQPYAPHILRGLRRRPPVYVMEFASTGIAPEWLVDASHGIVVVLI